MPHEGQIELRGTNILQSGKFGLEVISNGVWSRAVIFRAEVEVAPIPFGVDVHDVVPLGVFGGWLHEIRLQEGFYEAIGFLLNFSLDFIWHRGFCRNVDPLLVGSGYLFWHDDSLLPKATDENIITPFQGLLDQLEQGFNDLG
jgi:hypothetical protein